MIKIHTRLFKRLLALGFMCFITNQALAYEKSGFFVGIQGGTMGQEKTITQTQYDISIDQRTIGGTTTSGTTTSSSTTTSFGAFGFNIEVGGTVGSMLGAGSSNAGGFSVIGDSALNLKIDTKFTKNIQIVPDQPYSVGGVIGYKKIFSSGLNAKQYVGTNLTNHASGMRYYIAYDISAKGKKSAYSSTMVNANIDFLYNLFPDYNYFDVGGFLGVSVGWVKHRTSDYEVSGVDYGINFGVRWTIHSKHTIELFGRYGLSTLERRTANSHLENYKNYDLSSKEVKNESTEISGSTVDIPISNDGKIYVGTGTTNKSPVQGYYGSNSSVYYKAGDSKFLPNDKSGYYIIEKSDSDVHTFVPYDPSKGDIHKNADKYQIATITDETGTYGYRWDYADAEHKTKKITVNSTQGTFDGGRIETVRQTIQEYRSFPIDTIEEFRNPMRFGIRYTYTF